MMFALIFILILIYITSIKSFLIKTEILRQNTIHRQSSDDNIVNINTDDSVSSSNINSNEVRSEEGDLTRTEATLYYMVGSEILVTTLLSLSPSHIPPSYVTNNLPLVAPLLPLCRMV